jgi:hypothetical protein
MFLSVLTMRLCFMVDLTILIWYILLDVYISSTKLIKVQKLVRSSNRAVCHVGPTRGIRCFTRPSWLTGRHPHYTAQGEIPSDPSINYSPSFLFPSKNFKSPPVPVPRLSHPQRLSCPACAAQPWGPSSPSTRATPPRRLSGVARNCSRPGPKAKGQKISKKSFQLKGLTKGLDK